MLNNELLLVPNRCQQVTPHRKHTLVKQLEQQGGTRYGPVPVSVSRIFEGVLQLGEGNIAMHQPASVNQSKDIKEGVRDMKESIR